MEQELHPNAGKNDIIEVDGVRYQRLPIKTHLITDKDNILDVAEKYGKPVLSKPGDVLFLTKPLGIGILTTAQKAELLSEDGKQLAQRLMTTLNKSARDAMVPFRVHACTDVTGFSFLGHASEMAAGSDVQLRIDTAAIDLIPEALDFARMGILPAGMYRNRTFAEPMVDALSLIHI